MSPQSESDDLQDLNDAGSQQKMDYQEQLAIFGGIGAAQFQNEVNRERSHSRRSNSISEYPSAYRSRDSDVYNFWNE